jgi:hypothetical protein
MGVGAVGIEVEVGVGVEVEGKRGGVLGVDGVLVFLLSLLNSGFSFLLGPLFLSSTEEALVLERAGMGS